MNNHSILKYIFMLLIFAKTIIIENIYSQNIGNAEILIKNNSNLNLNITISPASAIYSGLHWNDGHSYEYSFSRSRRFLVNLPEWPNPNYITGGTKNIFPNEYVLIDFDDGDYYHTSSGTSRVLGGVSFGLWKMVLKDVNTNESESYYFEYRDFNIGNYPYPFFMDIYIYLDGIIPDSVNVFYAGAQQIVPMSDPRFQNRTIKIWDQVGRIDTATGQQLPPRIPNKGLFYSSNELPEYVSYPINPIKFGVIAYESPGDLGMNLVINHNVTTQDTALGNGNIYTVPNGYLKIASNKTFHMTKPLAGFHNLVVQDSSDLILDPYSSLIVDRYNSLTLQNKGEINLGWGSEIRFKDGSTFCNEGGKINSDMQGNNPGGGRIYFEKGYVNVICGTTKKHDFSDSVKLVLLDSCVLEVPDSVTLSFTGSGAGLIMNPNSKLKMGVGSKIVFDSSASIA